MTFEKEDYLNVPMFKELKDSDNLSMFGGMSGKYDAEALNNVTQEVMKSIVAWDGVSKLRRLIDEVARFYISNPFDCPIAEWREFLGRAEMVGDVQLDSLRYVHRAIRHRQEALPLSE